ncbi:hypothetical protein VB10N_25580 [Vibrio sp. 10N]|nr:hypothetical protein VB10N_25580 [Vibrio sp. 10N]
MSVLPAGVSRSSLSISKRFDADRFDTDRVKSPKQTAPIKAPFFVLLKSYWQTFSISMLY